MRPRDANEERTLQAPRELEPKTISLNSDTHLAIFPHSAARGLRRKYLLYIMWRLWDGLECGTVCRMARIIGGFRQADSPDSTAVIVANGAAEDQWSKYHSGFRLSHESVK